MACVIIAHGWRLGWRVSGALGPLARCSVDAGRAHALACVAGHGGSRGARKGLPGGGAERRSYSRESNIASETEATLRGASRSADGSDGAGDASHGKSRVARRNVLSALGRYQSATSPCQQPRQTPRLETRAKESSAAASVWVDKTRFEREVKAIRREAREGRTAVCFLAKGKEYTKE